MATIGDDSITGRIETNVAFERAFGGVGVAARAAAAARLLIRGGGGVVVKKRRVVDI